MKTAANQIREEQQPSRGKPGHGGARRNAGRWRRDTRPITLRLPPDVIEEIRRGAEWYGSTMSDWVCLVLRLRGLARMRFRKVMQLPPWHLTASTTASNTNGHVRGTGATRRKHPGVPPRPAPQQRPLF